MNAPVFDTTVNVKEDVVYSPKVFNMWPDGEPLWQCPGFEPDSGLLSNTSVLLSFLLSFSKFVLIFVNIGLHSYVNLIPYYRGKLWIEIVKMDGECCFFG